MQQLETATKSRAKHAQDTCSRNKITRSTKTHTQACKSCACNLITASGKQVSNGLRQENHRTYLSKLQAGFKLSLSSGGIQTPPFQYCYKVSKPHLSNIVARYPNPTFPILLQGIQTPPVQYCCKVSKPHLSNIVARYPNPTFPILLQGIQTSVFPILLQGIQTSVFPILFQGIQTSVFPI